MPVRCTSRDLPFNVIIAAPARNTVNNIKIRASISRRLVTNMANTPRQKALIRANSPKIKHFGSISTHLDH